MTTLPTIASFTYYLSTGEAVTVGVTSATVSISGHGGAWSLKVVISLASEVFGPEQFQGFITSGRHYRHQDTRTFRTRKLAKLAATSFLRDHLGDAFTGATYRVNGRTRKAAA